MLQISITVILQRLGSDNWIRRCRGGILCGGERESESIYQKTARNA